MSNVTNSVLAAHQAEAFQGLERVAHYSAEKYGKTWATSISKSNTIAGIWFVVYACPELYTYSFYDDATEAEKEYKKTKAQFIRDHAEY